MSVIDPIRSQRAPVRARLDTLCRQLVQAPGDAVAAYALADLALDHGFEEVAAEPVARAAARNPQEPRLWQMLGLLYRACERGSEAIAALETAARLAPDDARIAHALALSTLEAGAPATALYERAIRLAPTDGMASTGYAAALMAEGKGAAALAQLETMLRSNPGWLAGHHAYAGLSATLGHRESVTATIDAALAGDPANMALHAARLAILAPAISPEGRLRSIADARRAVADPRAFLSEEAVAASEAGDIARADAAFLSIGRHADPALALAMLRHLVRARRFDQVDGLAGKLVDGPESVTAWAYRQIAWRVLGDRRLSWLERDGDLVRVIDLTDRLPPLDRLADVLRNIHTGTAQPLDQSVRGGTQTDGPLFARIEPEIRAVRAAVQHAIADYAAALPPPDPAHPLLSASRDGPVRFAGSWSVRLAGAGHHVNHIHGQGWLSSALYVALPDAVAAGREGLLTIGAPPTELRLDLPPTATIAPKPGCLILFPSWQWHGVTPFGAGERLTIAFDVARPRG